MILCKNCKYFIGGAYKQSCIHDNNTINKGIDPCYGMPEYELKQKPEEINKDFNCTWFEEKVKSKKDSKLLKRLGIV